MLGRQLPQVLQELWIGQRQAAVVGAVGLDDNGGHVVSLGQSATDRVDVYGRDDDRVQRLLGDAAQGLIGLRRRVVVPTVEVVLEFYDLRLAGVGPGET